MNKFGDNALPFFHRTFDAASDAAAAAAAAAAKPWYDGKVTDPALIGHIQTHGWDKDPAVAALGAAQSHFEAQKLIGVPPAQLLRLPADMKNVDQMKEVWGKLGASAKAEDYDFSAVKTAKGEAPNAKLVDGVRAAVLGTVPKDIASAILTSVVKAQDSIQAEVDAVNQTNLDAQKLALTKDWGANFDAFKLMAAGAAKALGVTPEAVAALEKTIGYADTMKMFQTIATKIGEDKFVSGGGANGGAGGVLTREQAVSRKLELMGDPQFTKRLMDGGAIERREMTALNTLIAGGDDTEASRLRSGT